MTNSWQSHKSNWQQNYCTLPLPLHSTNRNKFCYRYISKAKNWTISLLPRVQIESTLYVTFAQSIFSFKLGNFVQCESESESVKVWKCESVMFDQSLFSFKPGNIVHCASRALRRKGSLSLISSVRDAIGIGMQRMHGIVCFCKLFWSVFLLLFKFVLICFMSFLYVLVL